MINCQIRLYAGELLPAFFFQSDNELLQLTIRCRINGFAKNGIDR